MTDSAWAAVLMGAAAVLLAIGFITLWMRDKGRADEQAGDPERMRTDAHLSTGSREGTAEQPPELRRERRH